MSSQDELITGYRFELVEDHHSIGSGRYSGRLVLPVDISASFPYLNALLDDAIYDHDNQILIGVSNRRRYAFRPFEIQVGMVEDPSAASSIADEVVELVNRVWRERGSITPSTRERKLPPVYDIYKLLPGTNCRECGYPTCLAFAGDVRNGVISLEKCPLLAKPEYAQNRERIYSLFCSDSDNNR
jgi:ArsR family metal-binding transcriptional regulator